jgi:molybdopterin-guanine dinucleotide biosynthesis protein
MILAIGGHSRNIGKTSLVCRIIEAFPERRWTAIKITQFGHGVCSEIGEECGCNDTPEHPFALDEEAEPGSSDSRRYLAAGAARSFWLRTAQGELAHGLPAFREVAATAENLIVESNSLIGFVRPALYLAVLDYSVPDFKESALRFLDRASALVVVDSATAEPHWPGVAPSLIASKSIFRVRRGAYFSDALREYLANYMSDYKERATGVASSSGAQASLSSESI